MDTVDTIFRWRCPKCGKELEEGNWSSLEAMVQMHERQCTNRTPGNSSNSIPNDKETRR